MPDLADKFVEQCAKVGARPCADCLFILQVECKHVADFVACFAAKGYESPDDNDNFLSHWNCDQWPYPLCVFAQMFAEAQVRLDLHHDLL